MLPAERSAWLVRAVLLAALAGACPNAAARPDPAGAEDLLDPAPGAAFTYPVRFDDGAPSGHATISAVKDRPARAARGRCP